MLLPESQSLKGLPPLTKSSYHSAPLRSETRVHGKSSGLLVARVARVGAAAQKIGRASCRERVWILVVDVLVDRIDKVRHGRRFKSVVIDIQITLKQMIRHCICV